MPEGGFKQLAQFAASLRRLADTASAVHLRNEMEAHAGILPVLSKQVRDASEDMGAEVASICLQFQEMAGSAQASVALVANLVGHSDTDRQSRDVIGDCRLTMMKLLDRIDQGNVLYSRAIAQMDAVNGSVADIFRVLAELNRTSYANKLLALNAKIEAVHLGSFGSSFEVVAEQISSQAARSNDLTEQVAGILTGLSATIKTATAEMKTLAQLDTEQAGESRRAVETGLVNLENVSLEMRKTLEQAGGATAKLVEGISSAVVSLQFQDRVSQRLAHVIESLDAMSEALSKSGLERSRQSETVAQDRRRQEISESLLSSYTMASERVAHEGHAEAQTPEMQGGDVELF